MRLRRGLLQLAVLTASAYTAANPYSGSARARAAYAQGAKLEKARHFAEAAEAYHRALTLDPKFASAWQKYYDARARAFDDEHQDTPEAEQKKVWGDFNARTNAELEALLARQPASPVYFWLNARRYEEDDPEKKRELCQKALSLDSSFLPGYRCLAEVAELSGDMEQAAAMLRRPLDADPKDTDTWLDYAATVRFDPALEQKAIEEIERRFPHSETAARARYGQALSKDSPAEQIAGLKRLVADYSPAKFQSGNYAAGELFYLEDATDPAAARDLAHACLKQMSKDADWKEAVAYADTMAAAQRQLDAGKAAEALAALKTLKPGLPAGTDRRDSLRARAMEASGDPDGAYRALLQAFATKPSDQAGESLYAMGARQGKSRGQVEGDVRSYRAEHAKPAKAFSLPDYRGGTTSLSDYQGRVVVLDFWFPNCGPCRSSFPFVRKLIDRYRDNAEVVFLGVNAMAGQEPFVLPVLRKERINWLPLKGNLDWCLEYGVSGFPTTRLIGRDGKIYFTPRVRTPDSERSAELAIDALLAMH